MAGVKPSHTPFDPAAHLAKQGWKGKGTALKQGHLTRPLAVVQKKTLSGVGKDRDEAVPFWDNIFAATAASLSLPASLNSSPGPANASGSSTPVPLHRLADPRTSKTTAWQTGSSLSSDNVASSSGTNKQAGLSTAVRISRETARRGLYSRFFRGEVISHEPSPEPEPQPVMAVAVETTVEASARMGSSSVSGPDEKESKEEKESRRAAKAARKEAKRVRREGKEARRAEKAEKKRKKEAVGGVNIDEVEKGIEGETPVNESKEGGSGSEGALPKERKKRKRKDV